MTKFLLVFCIVIGVGGLTFLDTILSISWGPWALLGILVGGGLLAVPWREEDAKNMNEAAALLYNDIKEWFNRN